jgi:hypothetical protein
MAIQRPVFFFFLEFPMKSLDRDGMRRIREAVDAALVGVAKSLGVALYLGSGSFLAESGHFKLHVAVLGGEASDDGEDALVKVEALTWKRHAEAYGFKPEDLGRKFYVGGTQYEICGLKTSRPRFPICAKRCKDGKMFKMPDFQVKAALG